MKALLECAAQHWVFSCVVMVWFYCTVEQVTNSIYNSIVATKRSK